MLRGERAVVGVGEVLVRLPRLHDARHRGRQEHLHSGAQPVSAGAERRRPVGGDALEPVQDGPQRCALGYGEIFYMSNV